MLFIEVIVTVGLISVVLCSLGGMFFQLKRFSNRFLTELELIDLVRREVFEQKRKVYQDPEYYIQIADKKEQTIPSIQIGKFGGKRVEVFPKMMIKNVAPRKKELSKSFLITLRAEARVKKNEAKPLGKKNKIEAKYSEKVLITQHLTK